jgi:predicted MFS family arabinose efflux permease
VSAEVREAEGAGEIAAAMALTTVPLTIARALGPAVAAFDAASVGPEIAFVIAAACGTSYALVILWLRLPGAPQRKEGTDFSVRASLRHLRTDPVLGLLLAGVAAVGVGADPSMTLTPALAESLGGGHYLVGWLASAFGIGAGLGFFGFAPLHRRLGLEALSSGGLALMAAGLAFSAVDAEWAALVLFGVAGVGMTLGFTSLTTLIQNRTPDALRGRIMALWFVGFLGARPIAAAMNGLLADTFNVDVALLVTAVVVACVAWLCRPRRLVSPVVAAPATTNVGSD